MNLPKAITYKKHEKTYYIRAPKGKIYKRKTEKGAIDLHNRTKIQYDIPSIVTANTYFWSPNGSASSRRSNEERRNNEINDFCAFCNTHVPNILVNGNYSESCHHVYKNMTYTLIPENRQTNLTGLIGHAAKWGVFLIK